VDTGNGTESSQRGGSSSGNVVSGAAAGTAESSEQVATDKPGERSRTAADSQAREQTLVFIGQDLDKVCRADALLLWPGVMCELDFV